MPRSHSRKQRGPGDEPEQVLYSPRGLVEGTRIRLEGSEAEHARRSLRLRTGDAVWIVDGAGKRHHGRISELDKHGLQVKVDGSEEIREWPERKIVVGAGVLRTNRMDFLVEKASELGVSALTPLQLKRCVARPHEEGTKLERWQRLAVESLKQCKRARLMEVHNPEPLDAFLAGVPVGGTLWVADPEGAPPEASLAGNASTPLTLVVGPEGGLAPEERALLVRAGGVAVGLGAHRLRAETAVIALVTAALAVTRAFRGPWPPDVDP